MPVGQPVLDTNYKTLNSRVTSIAPNTVTYTREMEHTSKHRKALQEQEKERGNRQAKTEHGVAWHGMAWCVCVCPQREVVSQVLARLLEEGFEVVMEDHMLMDICEGLEAWPDSIHNGLHEGTHCPPTLLALSRPVPSCPVTFHPVLPYPTPNRVLLCFV